VNPRAATRNTRGLSVLVPLTILLMLIFSKFFYLASISSYYTFYLIHSFGVSVRNAQVHLFFFLGAVAVGTLVGGPLGDKIGRKYVIWFSILGMLPFTLMLPYADLFWTGILSVVIGLIMASAFPAIVVYAQELLPGRVGMISGLFFGFSFGMGGIGAAVLGGGWTGRPAGASGAEARSAPTTRDPSAKSRTAVARPMPEAAPVTM